MGFVAASRINRRMDKEKIRREADVHNEKQQKKKTKKKRTLGQLTEMPLRMRRRVDLRARRTPMI